MTQHDRAEFFRPHLQHIHVVDGSVLAQSRIEKQGLRSVTAADTHQRGKAVLGHEAFAGEGIRAEREAFGLRRAGHKNIDCVVQDGQDLNLVYLLEWHPGHDYASYRGALVGTLTCRTGYFLDPDISYADSFVRTSSISNVR